MGVGVGLRYVGIQVYTILICWFFFLNRAAVGWAVSCSAFGLFYFFFKPRSRRLGGFLLCLRFIFFLVLSVSRPKLPLGLLSSPDDVIISQLQAISQLFSSYPPSGAFCQASKLTIQKEHGRL